MFFSQNIKWSTEFTFCNVTHIIVRKHLLKLFSENSAYSIFVITVVFLGFFFDNSLLTNLGHRDRRTHERYLSSVIFLFSFVLWTGNFENPNS